MSKVVHLSDDAHAKAKEYCRQLSLKMSDWVAGLIDQAISAEHSPDAAPEPAETNVRAFVPRKKVLQRLDETTQSGDDGVPVYAQPPFWKRVTGK